ncbi:MAG: polyribonucleotide nucleotidyltransferase [Verrucomicrobiota bacterium]|nr:polyribonucleotide nucleotidyltransferase [Limisphaera sp.]MDW8382869.1 polyribonucleotide nucleotidyltransferase [Verrucomicrobiota bacterium]
MHTRVSAQVGDKTIQIETGKIAKQADGAVTVQLGETIVIVAAVGATQSREGADFFPLTVDYREKAAAAGRFPGGYFKREGRPTEKEIVTSRMIDRPLRPLFPKGWFNEVQVQAIVLSADGQNDPDVLCVNGASAALMISDIPWDGPVAAVRIGRIDGRFVVNPTHKDLERSDLDLVYVGTERELVMFEGSAREISESDFLAALEFGHQAIQPLIAVQRELASRVGRAKRTIRVQEAPAEILARARELAGDRLVPALLTPGKLAREAALNGLFEEVGRKLLEEFGSERVTEFVLNEVRYDIQRRAVRDLILREGKRLDGRGMEEVRPIQCEVGLLPRAHGSALFARGETQALVLATLGTGEDAQEFDAYTGGATEKRFILHYNFPNFSVGETGRITGPGRREIGHGNLAERSLAPLLPLEDYPYTVRVTSEIMESNGSTSMATVCGGSLALMDAGIPLQRAVAGISIGLVTEYDAEGRLGRYQLLTDLIGAEDHFGDMDCKIAGSERGITGFQLDLKLRGLPLSVIGEAVERARVARLAILQEMNKVLAAPRPQLSKYAPRIVTLKIDPEKIGTLIGPGGKNIKKLVDESGCEIDIEDDGTVHIYSLSEEGMRIAREAIEALSAEAEVGKIYRGKVVTIKDFGAFVEFLPGKDGLVHISELANFRVKKTEDIVKIGDEIWVKVLGVDEKGRVRLSRRAAMNERDAQLAAQAGGGSAAAGVAGQSSEQASETGAAEEKSGEADSGTGASGGATASVASGSGGGRSTERTHRSETRDRGHRQVRGRDRHRRGGRSGGSGGGRSRDRR